jgi:uncharacterized protein
VIERRLAAKLLESLETVPVTVVLGPRGAGKTTLIEQLSERGVVIERVLDLEDAGVLARARRDPATLLGGPGSPSVIDEVQRSPELLSALAAFGEGDRRPGRVCLVASALPRELNALLGALGDRCEALYLWPLAGGETTGGAGNLVDLLFDGRRIEAGAGDTGEIWGRVARGGYPAVVEAAPPEAGRRLGRLLSVVLERDVRNLSSLDDLAAVYRCLELTAEGSGEVQSFSDMARAAGLPQSTLKRYVALLEATFLVRRIPAWEGATTLRLVKSPKLFPCDTGIASHVLGADADRLAGDTRLADALLEAFVMNEFARLAGWSRRAPHLSHFATHSGRVVDLVLEDSSGRCIGVQVSSAANVEEREVAGLLSLASVAGERFLRGVVLYAGAVRADLEPGIEALPLAALWSWSRGDPAVRRPDRTDGSFACQWSVSPTW